MNDNEQQARVAAYDEMVARVFRDLQMVARTYSVSTDGVAATQVAVEMLARLYASRRASILDDKQLESFDEDIAFQMERIEDSEWEVQP